MDYTLQRTPPSLHFLPRNPLKLRSDSNPYFKTCYVGRRKWGETSLVVVARTGPSQCEPSSSSSGNSSLNTPLEPNSSSGKFLSRVLQNKRQLFHAAVADELKILSYGRDSALARMYLSCGSDEASLHRRIAELKEKECQAAVEDVMYMLIFYKFSEIKVPLVPKLSRCVYNGRLEISPTKDWELESIHSFEALELIKLHISIVTSLRANSSVTDSWVITEIKRVHLARAYAASILYGYFLKSASVRHHLERCFRINHPDDIRYLGHKTSLKSVDSSPHGSTNLVSGRTQNTLSASSGLLLRHYVMGFDGETFRRCARPKSMEAVSLYQKHTCALLGDEESGSIEIDEVILTSLSSLKRLVLEAVAFGSFLWEAEEYVNSVYKLKEM